MAEAKSFFERITGARTVPATSAEAPRERTLLAAERDRNVNTEHGDEDYAPQTEEEGELTVDIYDDDDEIVIQAFIGGVKPEDMDVQVTDDLVTLRGKRARSQEVQDDKFFYHELYWGVFARSIVLPQEVISDEAEASMKNGLLTIKLPKRDRNKAQKLRVKSD